eukprot:TRINITY_DN4133_c0_g1_i1.p1 TRINITY_DN4133_c0_g1~~TRINITY_DN4133_c0_g1_i1.p1  ORF type:complete len:274 (-),score=42.91 TRINITY_DN4133_c0_g1_i1:28-849(-)
MSQQSQSEAQSSSPLEREKPSIKPFVPERILFCIDTDDEMMGDELSNRSALLPGVKKSSRLHHIKQILRVFVLSKLRMSQIHEFALCALTTDTHWFCDFTSDSEKIMKAISNIKTAGSHPTYNVSSLFEMVRAKFPIFSPRNSERGVFSRQDSEEFVYRIIFIYSRSNIEPQFISIPKQTLFPQIISHPLLFFDALYVHSKASSSNSVQSIYDTITDISNPEKEGEESRSYFFEASTNLKRLYAHFAMLLVNPLQRPHDQSAFSSELIPGSKE